MEQESKLTVPWLAILSLVGILLASLFGFMLNHEGRIVKTETLLPTIVETQKAMDIKQDQMLQVLTEVREDQKARKRAGYPEYQGLNRQERKH